MATEQLPFTLNLRGLSSLIQFPLDWYSTNPSLLAFQKNEVFTPVFTDGSKTEYGTGSGYHCQTKEALSKLGLSNNVRVCWDILNKPGSSSAAVATNDVLLTFT